MADFVDEIPSCASEWRISDVERLSISYELVVEGDDDSRRRAATLDSANTRNDHHGCNSTARPSPTRSPTKTWPNGMRTCKWFFRHIGKIKQDDGAWWDKLDQFVKKRRALHSGELIRQLDIGVNTSRMLLEVIRQGGVVERNENVLQNVIRQVSDTMWSVVVSRRQAETSGSSKEYESLGKVMSFLTALDEILRRTAAGSAPADADAAFLDLFQRFAHLCLMQINPGSSTERTMNIFGKPVTSVPHIQYGGSFGEFLVVTASKFKRNEKCIDENIDGYTPRPSNASRKRGRETTVDFIDDESRPKKSRSCLELQEEACDDDGSDRHLLGQHAAELLLELPHSAWRKLGNGGCMFGLIVRANKVRLTCLKLTEEHLGKLRAPQEVSLAEECAKIHYTQSYDLLNRNDREILECVLLTLSYLAKDKSQI